MKLVQVVGRDKKVVAGQGTEIARTITSKNHINEAYRKIGERCKCYGEIRHHSVLCSNRSTACVLMKDHSN